MTDGLILFSDIAAGYVRIVICLYFASGLLSVKKPGKKSMVSAAAGIAAIMLIVSAAGLSDIYRIALETFLICVCAVCFQSADIRMSLFFGIFYEIAIHFWIFLFAAWIGVLFHSPVFLENGTGYGQIAVWLVDALIVILAFYTMMHQEITRKEAFRAAAVVCAAGFFAVISLSEQKVFVIADDTLFMWTILAVVLMMSVLVFNMNRQYEMERELANLKSEQAKLLERDYTALNQAYAVNAKLFHDFHNHIGALRQLLSHDKTGEALRYLDELQAPMRDMTDAVWTGDETIDYLINSKTAAAAADKIQTEIQVEFPRHTNIRSVDLCAVLGNLLDNALEAAKGEGVSGQRFIRLTIRRINQMIVIKVENSFAVPPVKEDGVWKTTKEKNGLHGWGLKSAQTAAEKYEGMIRTSCEGSTFRAVATLCFQGVSTEEL